MTHRERYERLAAKVRAAEANDPYRKYVSLAGDLLGLCGELMDELEAAEAFPIAWAKMDKATRQRFLDLPNFDAAKFYECTGVDVRQPAKRTITLDNGRKVDISVES